MLFRKFISGLCIFALVCISTTTGCNNSTTECDTDSTPPAPPIIANIDSTGFKTTYDLTASRAKKYTIVANEDTRVLVDIDGMPLENSVNDPAYGYNNWHVRVMTSSDTPFKLLAPYGADATAASAYSFCLGAAQIYGEDTDYTEYVDVFANRLVEMSDYTIEDAKSFFSWYFYTLAKNDYSYDELNKLVDLSYDSRLQAAIRDEDYPIHYLVDLFYHLCPNTEFNCDLANRVKAVSSEDWGISQESLLRLLGAKNACDLKTAVNEYMGFVSSKDMSSEELKRIGVLLDNNIKHSNYPSYLFLELKAGSETTLMLEYEEPSEDEGLDSYKATQLDFIFTSESDAVELRIEDSVKDNANGYCEWYETTDEGIKRRGKIAYNYRYENDMLCPRYITERCNAEKYSVNILFGTSDESNYDSTINTKDYLAFNFDFAIDSVTNRCNSLSIETLGYDYTIDRLYSDKEINLGFVSNARDAILQSLSGTETFKTENGVLINPLTGNNIADMTLDDVMKDCASAFSKFSMSCKGYDERTRSHNLFGALSFSGKCDINTDEQQYFVPIKYAAVPDDNVFYPRCVDLSIKGTEDDWYQFNLDIWYFQNNTEVTITGGNLDYSDQGLIIKSDDRYDYSCEGGELIELSLTYAIHDDCCEFIAELHDEPSDDIDDYTFYSFTPNGKALIEHLLEIENPAVGSTSHYLILKSDADNLFDYFTHKEIKAQQAKGILKDLLKRVRNTKIVPCS